MDTLAASAVVPTLNRPDALCAALDSLEMQGVLPAELIVIDASDDTRTRDLIAEFDLRVRDFCSVQWIPASDRGAASQRNQGVGVATQPVIWFFDDDIIFEPECVTRLWRALQSDSQIGGVNAMIVNQRYEPPGIVSRVVFELLHGRKELSYAGKIIGPAVNLLPEDREDLPEVVQVDWLNTTCTLYRREALPYPPFPQRFTGYSLMEDVTLSLLVGRTWKLANARTARICHKSRPGAHKADVAEVARMQLVNRHYVMTHVLGRNRASDHMRLVIWELFQVAACGVRRSTRAEFSEMWRGKWRAWQEIRKAVHKENSIPAL
jgi:GT2 family glycosyltransferase